MVAMVSHLHVSVNEEQRVYNNGALPNIAREKYVRIASSFPYIIYWSEMGEA